MKKMMRSCISLICILALVFVSFGNVFDHKVEAAVNYDYPKGAYVAAQTTYQGGGHKSTSHGISMYMSISDANAYAAKLNVSYTSTISWGLASFIKGVGPYITAAGILNSLNSQKKAKEILALTKAGKKVNVSVNSGMMSVRAWDGKASSVKTNMPNSSTKKTGGITTSITTKIKQKVMKY